MGEQETDARFRRLDEEVVPLEHMGVVGSAALCMSDTPRGEHRGG